MEGEAVLSQNALSWQPLVQELCLPRPEDTPESAIPTAAGVSSGPPLSDRALAEACKSGSLTGYEQLYRLHGTRMKSIAHNLLGNANDAEDAVQEVFLKIHRSVKNFQGQSAFSTWVYRILMNACYDMMREKKRRQEVPELGLEPEGSEEKRVEPPAPSFDPALKLALERYVSELTPSYRRVFLLAEVEGMSHAEIAGVLSITETASKNLLYQAKQRLRKRLLESGRIGRTVTP